MKIAIDARELAGKPTGVGRYLAEILSAWAEMADAAAHEFVLCAPDPVRVPGQGNLHAAMRTTAGSGTLWEQRALPNLIAGSDVLFAPGYTAPVRTRIPVVVTIHDVSFAAHPEWFSWRERLRRRLLTRLSARRAAKVITVSQFSKQEIVRHLWVAPAKVDVIYSGVTTMPQPATSAGRQPLVLYVGSLFNRRHLPELIAGFERLAAHHPDARLDIVGDNRTRPHVDIDALIARNGARDRIRARAYVSDDELAELYGRASVFAFLSSYEGFALTPLEALAAGVPVALLDTDVAREIYGAAALYIARAEPDLIARALERLLVDGSERRRLLDAATVQLQRYSWRDCARRTLAVLVEAGSRNPNS